MLVSSGIKKILTTRQSMALDPEMMTWNRSLLDKIFDLTNTIVRDYGSGQEATTVQQYIEEVRMWMEEDERTSIIPPFGQLDVQHAVQRCQAELAKRREEEGRANVELSQKMFADYRVIEERKKAIQDTLNVLKTCIDDHSENFEEAWKEIENEIDKRHGELESGLELWLHEQFVFLWEQSKPPPSHHYIFPSNGVWGRPKGKKAKLEVTWQLPPGGKYNKSTGAITYETSHDYKDVYGASKPEISVQDAPYTNPVEVEPLIPKMIAISLNNQPGRMAPPKNTASPFINDFSWQGLPERPGTAGSSSRWSEEL
jgi:hypothetical protein